MEYSAFAYEKLKAAKQAAEVAELAIMSNPLFDQRVKPMAAREARKQILKSARDEIAAYYGEQKAAAAERVAAAEAALKKAVETSRESDDAKRTRELLEREAARAEIRTLLHTKQPHEAIRALEQETDPQRRRAFLDALPVLMEDLRSMEADGRWPGSTEQARARLAGLAARISSTIEDELAPEPVRRAKSAVKAAQDEVEGWEGGTYGALRSIDSELAQLEGQGPWT